MIYADWQPARVRKKREARVRERQMASRAWERKHGLVAHLICDVFLELRDEVSELNGWEMLAAYAIEGADRLDELAETDPDYEVFRETNNLVVAHLAVRVIRVVQLAFPFVDMDSDMFRRKCVSRSRMMSMHSRFRHARRIRKLTYKQRRRKGVPEPKFSGPKMIVRRNSE